MATGDIITLASKDFVNNQLNIGLDDMNTTQQQALDLKANIAGQVFTGNVTVPNLITSGTVDGRDVSVDGAVLDSLIAVEEI